MDTITPTEEATPRTRISLRDAVRLCGMSEKTLRRKLEAGLLHGSRETLDYGGFMWMIETRSLAELYPDSASLRDYIRSLETNFVGGPPAPEPATLPVPADSAPENEASDEHPAFLSYLVEENRSLKDSLKEKEERLRELERECGEQRGTAATQARVLEWFQKQPQPALPAPPTEIVQPAAQSKLPALGGALAASVLIFLLLAVVRFF